MKFSNQKKSKNVSPLPDPIGLEVSAPLIVPTPDNGVSAIPMSPKPKRAYTPFVRAVKKPIKVKPVKDGTLAISLNMITGWALMVDGKIINGMFDLSYDFSGSQSSIVLGFKFRLRLKDLLCLYPIKSVYFRDIPKYHPYLYVDLKETLISWCKYKKIPCYGVDTIILKSNLSLDKHARDVDIENELIERKYKNIDKHSLHPLSILDFLKEAEHARVRAISLEKAKAARAIKAAEEALEKKKAKEVENYIVKSEK